MPIVIFHFIQSFRFEKGLIEGAEYLLDFVMSYIREFVFDPDTLNDGVQKFSYNYDVKKIPLYENQEGDWRDLEMVESIWKMVLDTIACTLENETNDVLSSGSLSTPPVRVVYIAV